MKVYIILHSGNVFETEVESYDPAKITELINDETKSVVQIGEVVVHRTNISMVVPATSKVQPENTST